MPRFSIADAHADSLMWNRDLVRPSSVGHVDFPRLRESGVKLQCFTIVTRGFPYVDGFPLFALAHRWPRAARKGPWARALFQIGQLEASCARSGGQVRLTRTARELEENFERGALSAILGVEGGHALEGDAARVAELHRRGVRFLGLTHLANNELGGAAFFGMGNRPLSPFGEEVLERMASLGMPVDVAHASERTLEGILSRPAVRPFCSHTGVGALSSPWRNLSDRALRAIADRGGVVGVIFAPVYLGGRSIDDVARHVLHAVRVMGEDGVALGSDFDGMVALPRGMRDCRDTPKVLDALLRLGMGEAQVEKVACANLQRFFRENLGAS